MAVAHADSILQLQENLESKEMPPEWMWPLSWEMEQHMAKVSAARREKYGIEDDDDDPVPYEGDGWLRNELADEWKR